MEKTSDNSPAMGVLASSTVFIDRLRMHARHGVLPQERLTGNDYTVSLSASFYVGRAMATDDVADTLDYAALCCIVKEEMSVPSKLIEHVAGRIARRVIRTFPSVGGVTVSIVKVNPPMGADCKGAGVEIHLTNEKTL